MQFSEVIGQQQVKQHLAEMVSHNRLSHALLFSGKEGTGGLPMALAFAQYVLCERTGFISATAGPSLFGDELPEPGVRADSCGECASCRKCAAAVHPDLHFTYPVVSKKPGDKPVSTDYITEWREFIFQHPYGNAFDWLQSIGADNRQGNITAHECNDIIHKLSLKSFESEYKVLVLWLPEYLGNEGNKLLKLIEEPPPKTLFILVTENEQQILSTIRSRTQLVRIPPLGSGDIAAHLVQQGNLDVVQAGQIAAIAGGSYREAMQLYQHAGEDWLEVVRDWLNAIMKNGPVSQVKWIEEISKHGREKQKQFLRYFNHLMELGIRLRVMPASGELIPQNEHEFVVRLNRITDIGQQQAIVEELDRASYYIERNAHTKILFHALTIRLYHIIADKSLILTS